MEFEITTNLDTIRNQTISANFSAVAEWLDKELKPYIGLVVTEDAIPTAKAYRASLRKVRERIEDYRKEAKKAALAPYEIFEAKAKILTGKIDEAVENIDGQVKDFERREAEAKIEDIRACYESDLRVEAKEYRPWETIFNPKWVNKGYKIEDAKEEINAALYQTEVDLKSIREWAGDDTPYLLGVYKDNHDLNVCIRKSQDIKAEREREEKRKRDREALERQDLEQKRALIEPVMSSASATTGNLVTVDFRVYCTKEQLSALGQYMKDNGIKYGRCK